MTFPGQLVGVASAAQQLTITNTSAIGVQIAHIQASGDFEETNNCGTTLSAMNSCNVNVTYTPSAAGNFSGTLAITDNAADSPQTVALTGSGMAANLGLNAPSAGSNQVTAGQTAMYAVEIGGAGVGGTASLSCTGF